MPFSEWEQQAIARWCDVHRTKIETWKSSLYFVVRGNFTIDFTVILEDVDCGYSHFGSWWGPVLRKGYERPFQIAAKFVPNRKFGRPYLNIWTDRRITNYGHPFPLRKQYPRRKSNSSLLKKLRFACAFWWNRLKVSPSGRVEKSPWFAPLIVVPIINPDLRSSKQGNNNNNNLKN